MKKNYIPSAILEKIKNDVKLELSINYSDNNEVSNNLVENSVEPQSLQSLPNHNDSFCCQNNSTPNNTIQNDINNLDLSYNDIQSDQQETKSRVLPHLLFYRNVFLRWISRFYLLAVHTRFVGCLPLKNLLLIAFIIFL
jgi:hypothetical protein